MTMFVLSPFVATTAASASLEPASLEDGDVHAVTDDEAAAPGPEPGERILVLVDDCDLPAVGCETLCDGGSNAATSDDDGVHEARSVLLEDARRGTRRRAPRTAPCAGR